MRGERRKNFRVEWNLPATIYDLERRLDRPCILSNFSNTGAKITGVRADTIPNEFLLSISVGRTRKCRVLWRSDHAVGVKFSDCSTEAKEPTRKQDVGACAINISGDDLKANF
jgi:PilZ domain